MQIPLKKISVHAYKYDGTLYKTIEFPNVVFSNDEIVILSLEKAWIISSNKKRKKFHHAFSNNDSFMIFLKDKWYNFFVNINRKENSIIYYFNIASPYMYEEDTIKYIDLDLDVKCSTIDNNLKYVKLLDYNEFKVHAQEMNYPKKLYDLILKMSNHVINLIKIEKICEKYNLSFFININRGGRI